MQIAYRMMGCRYIVCKKCKFLHLSWHSILHVFVCRVAIPDQKKQKKERKELQVRLTSH